MIQIMLYFLIGFGIFMGINLLFCLILRHNDYREDKKNEGRN